MAGNSKDRQPDSKPSSRRLSADRAQSETVGVLLITAVVIILVASVGFVLTSNVMSQMETGPQITISGEASQDDLTVYHLGGARLEVSELDVVLRGDSTERYPLSSFTQRRGSNETWFERGDRWQREHGLSGDSVEVLVVHTPSETVVGRTTLELRPTGPFFEVDITGTNSPVEQGETLEVDAAVENTGIDTGTQDLEFSFDGTVQETESITLSPDQRTSRTFNFDTSSVDPGTYTVTASTDNRTDERTVTVEEPRANITITDVEGMPDETTNHSYQPAVTIEESAGIETDGLQVEFIIDERDTNVTAFEELRELNEISSSSVTADFDVGELDVNNYNYFATASADNAITDSRSGEFVVGEPPFFNVSIVDDNSPVRVGDDIEIDARVENTGGFEGTQRIELTVDGIPIRESDQSQDVTLESGENRTITLRWQTETGDQGDSPYIATVSSDDDSDSMNVEVTGPGGGQADGPVPSLSDLDIAGQDTDATITEEEGGDVTVDVMNDGDESGAFTIDLDITNGETVSDQETTGELDPGETETITFTDPLSGLSAGEYDVTVADEDDISSVTGSLTVESEEDPTSLRSASVENIGTSETEQQTFEFTLDRALADGEEVTIDLEDPQAANQVDYRGATVSADNGGSAAFTIQQNNNAEITYTASGEEQEGDSIEIQVTGIDADGSQTVNNSPYDVVFEGPDGDTITETFEVISG